MSTSRVARFDHKVEINRLLDNTLMIHWKGFQERHDYFLAESLEDLDILITELSQAFHNYKRRYNMYKRNAK